MDLKQVDENYGRYQIIGTFEITKIEAGNRKSRPFTIVTVTPMKLWKSNGSPPNWFYTGSSVAACEFQFEAGKEYIVFAQEFSPSRELSLSERSWPDGYLVSSCSPTIALAYPYRGSPGETENNLHNQYDTYKRSLINYLDSKLENSSGRAEK